VLDRASTITVIQGAGHINDAYDQLRLLSMEGSFSCVFVAREISTGRDIVLKFFAADGQPERELAFERESRVLTSLADDTDHFVNLLQPHSIFTKTLSGGNVTLTVNIPFVALEWMKRGPCNIGNAPQSHVEALHRLAIFGSMCRAVRRAHHRGIVHRDVKPSNFLFKSRSTVKLADFGSAVIVDSTRGNYHSPPRGDLRYTAPEALLDIPWACDIVCGFDIYSLGCCLFELFTGQTLVAHSVFGDLRRFVRFGTDIVTTTRPDQRRKVYDTVLGREDPRVPSIRTINPDLPKCLYPRLETLLHAVAHFDYRYRERSFDQIHRLAQICQLVVSNEMKTQRRTHTRRARRQVTP